MPENILIQTKEEYEIAARLFREYANWLNIDLCFQHFDEELEHLQSMYAAPNGGIILSRFTGQYIGCVGVRKIDLQIAELKRMYVQPDFQRRGIGYSLLQDACTLAKKLGYKKIRLDTLNTMHSAIKLYTVNGFYEIPAYYYNPEATAVYFEKLL